MDERSSELAPAGVEYVTGKDERRIDTMPYDQIVCQLVRIAAWAKETYRLYHAQAMARFKVRADAVALGRREVCASLLNDLRVTFGIEV